MNSSNLTMREDDDEEFCSSREAPYSQVPAVHRLGGVASIFCSPRFFLFWLWVGFPHPKKAPGSVSSKN